MLYYDRTDVSEGTDVNYDKGIKRVWYLSLSVFSL